MALPVAQILDHSLRINRYGQVVDWVSYSDPDGDAVTKYQFFDGATAASSGYFWTPGNHHHPAGTYITVLPGDLDDVWVRGGQTPQSDSMYVRAHDGTSWGIWDQFTLTTLPNATPVATISDHSVERNEWSRVDNWIAYLDTDGDNATQYQFWDSGATASSGYFWTPDNTHHPANTTITVAAADLDELWVRGGQAAGSETLWVRAHDGSEWGAWDTFKLTTIPNTLPVATISDQSLSIGKFGQVVDWLSYSDVDGDNATKYEFWDSGATVGSGHFWTPGNHHHPANMTISVAAADLDDVWVRGGQASGVETLWVRAFDGEDWGGWDTFTLTTLPNAAPVATVNDHGLQINEWSKVESWVAYSDTDGNPATQYQFWDGTATASSGYFWTPGNAHHPAGMAITVLAGDLDQLWVRGGQGGGADTMYVRAFDGSEWGNWDSFALTTIQNVPVATIDDHSLQTNEWSKVESWVAYSDADGHPATQYQFWDGGGAASSGYFWTPGNAHHAAGTAITVLPGDLDQLWVRGGQTPQSETMYVRAFDGTDWSAWDSFTFTTLV